MRALLEIRNISKAFPGVQALDRISVQINEGEIHALVGENGAGKSTLIKILAGLYSKDSGEILLAGETLQINKTQDSYTAGFRFIHQDTFMVPYFTVAENIFLGQEPAFGYCQVVDFKKMRVKAEELLARLNIMISPNAIISDLSLAEKRMVAIARSVATGAKILVLDEPTAPLSQQEITALFKMIRYLASHNTTIIYISHRLEEVFELADKVTVLRNGKLVETLTVARTTSDKLIKCMIGKNLMDKYLTVERGEIGEPLLKLTGLTREDFFSDISFTLHKREVLGIAGLVGAGRTEVLRAIFGADPIDSGQIELEGEKITIRSPRVAKQHGLSLIPEERRIQGLVTNLAVKNNICLSILEILSRMGFIPKKEEAAVANNFMTNLSIQATSIKQRVKYLSGGNQQKVVVAKWLASGSKVFMFDEPTEGVDVGAKTQIYKLMGEIAREGAGLIFVSSEIPELLALCDRILVMHRGKIVVELDPRETSVVEILTYAMKGGNTSENFTNTRA